VAACVHDVSERSEREIEIEIEQNEEQAAVAKPVVIYYQSHSLTINTFPSHFFFPIIFLLLHSAAAISGSANRFLVVKRGVCSYLSKALLAEAAGAVALLVVNDQPGLFAMPAGHELNTAEREAVPKNIAVLLLQEDSFLTLQLIGGSSEGSKGILVPHECTGASCIPVYPLDVSMIAQFDASSGRLFIGDLDYEGIEFVSR
jgi:hypothetical protein